jgi:hypothetical protein
MLRSWEIRLNLLTEMEIQILEAFFTSQQGEYSPFTFPDPFTGSDIPNCRLGVAGLISEYIGVDANSVSFWVLETNA